MLVVISQGHIPMLCQIVSESAVDVFVRIRPGRKMDAPKELILAVEAAFTAAEDRVH
jgi:hypothetical protein